MAASVQNPTDIVNGALARIGYKGRIGNLYDGSAAAKKALDLYAQTRDQLLRVSDWGFAEKIVTATVNGVAPAPWTTQYVYPADCLRLRNMFAASYLADKNNPLPVLYTVASNAGAKVIWSKSAGATLVYTAQITDPTQWEPLFVDALIASMARQMAPALNASAWEPEAKDEKVAGDMAEGTIG